MNKLEPGITAIEGLHFLKAKDVNPERLLMKLDGTTLRITQLSWFSIKPTHKKIFDELMELYRVREVIIIQRATKLLRAKVPDKLEEILSHHMNTVNGLMQFHTQQLSSYIDGPIKPHTTENERFITKIIRFISEYFGWRLSTENVGALRATLIKHNDELTKTKLIQPPEGSNVNSLKKIYNSTRKPGEGIQAFGLTQDGLLQFHFKTQEDRATCRTYLGEQLGEVEKSLNNPTESEIRSSTDDNRTYILTLSLQDTKTCLKIV